MSIINKYSRVMNNDTPSWESQSKLFDNSNDFGASSGLAGSAYTNNFSNVMNSNPTRSWENESALWSNNPNYNATTGTSNFAPNTSPDGGFLGSVTGVLGNRDLMSGLMGAGQLGLGLANYFQTKPLYEEQLKALEQNRDIQKERFNRHKRSADAFRSGSVEDRV